MKRTDLKIIGIEKEEKKYEEDGKEDEEEGSENIFNKIVLENVPNLKKDCLQRREGYVRCRGFEKQHFEVSILLKPLLPFDNLADSRNLSQVLDHGNSFCHKTYY